MNVNKIISHGDIDKTHFNTALQVAYLLTISRYASRYLFNNMSTSIVSSTVPKFWILLWRHLSVPYYVNMRVSYVNMLSGKMFFLI